MRLGGGDWNCPKCNYRIFGRKQYCSKCNIDRDGDKKPPRFGDWICNGCGGNIFARKDKCRCGVTKEGSKTMPPYQKKEKRKRKKRDRPTDGQPESKKIKDGYANDFNQSSSTTTTTTTTTEEEREEKICCICLDNPIEMGFLHGDTIHNVCCGGCASQIFFGDKKECPLCREPITKLIKVYS